MDITSFSQLISATTVVVVAVLVAYVLARLIRQDGYGNRPAPTSRPDWGTRSIPSRPYRSHL